MLAECPEWQCKWLWGTVVCSHPNKPISLSVWGYVHWCMRISPCMFDTCLRCSVMVRQHLMLISVFPKPSWTRGGGGREAGLRMGEGMEIEQWAYLADGSGWFPRRCVCVMRVYETGFAWVHTWKEESLFITPCFASLSPPLPSPPQFPGHHLSWARPNCSPEINLHLRTNCINLTPPFSKWTRVKFYRIIPLLLRT